MKRIRSELPPTPRHTTMLELVQSLTRQGIPEQEVVATVLSLVESRRVILTGNFRGVSLRSREDEST